MQQNKLLIPDILQVAPEVTLHNESNKRHYEHLRQRKPQSVIKTPDIVRVLEAGAVFDFQPKDIVAYTRPTYDIPEIVIEDVHFEVKPHEPSIHGNYISMSGKCNFTKPLGYPEARLDHVGVALLTPALNQGGKIFHTICTGMNGIALTQCDFSFRSSAAPDDVIFQMNGKVFQKMGQHWSKNFWTFLHKGKRFATVDIMTRAVQREFKNQAV